MKPFSVIIALLMISLGPVRAEAPKAAVFDFELVDTSLEGEMRGPRQDEQARLLLVTDQLRKAIAESGRYVLVDIAPVQSAAHNSNLQACGGCDVQLAKQLDADVVITGVVQKVSTLILNMNIYLRDAHSGTMIAMLGADLRGDTDESWSRTMAWLIHNRLLVQKDDATQKQ
jgi:Protein of unknown function (DUF2380)